MKNPDLSDILVEKKPLIDISGFFKSLTT